MSPSLDATGRPAQVLLVAGTATEVGKTWVGAELARRLAGSVRVAARKPAQSFDPGDAGPTDAEVLAAATGERPEDVCAAHRWYERAYAPPMAAAALGRPPVRLAELLAELRFPDGTEVGLIETVGGVRSPIAEDADTVDLRDALGVDATVLVADAGLGTVNAVLTAIDALGRQRLVVLLNRFDGDDDLHQRNRDWLRHRCDVDVVTSVAALAARWPRWCRQAGDTVE